MMGSVTSTLDDDRRLLLDIADALMKRRTAGEQRMLLALVYDALTQAGGQCSNPACRDVRTSNEVLAAARDLTSARIEELRQQVFKLQAELAHEVRT